MSGHSSVNVLGRLTRDAEVRHATSGMAVVSISVAVNEKVKRGDDWVEEATFIDVKGFGKQSEAFARHHRRGSQCYIVGKLRMDSWEDKTTGQKRSKLFVVMNSWTFVGGDKSAGSPTQSQSQSEPDPWANQAPADEGDTPF